MPSFIQQLDDHGNPMIYTDVPVAGKRRRDGTDEGTEMEVQMKIASQQCNASLTLNFPAANIHPFRQIVTPTRRSPSAVHKRRLLHAISPKPSLIVSDSYQDPFYSAPTTYTPAPYTEGNTIPINLDAMQENIRTINQTITSYQSSTTNPSSTPSQQQGAAKKFNLSPCNVCKRRPMVKRDLDSFADCEGCGQRTCYICVRQCEGTAQCIVASNPAQHENHEMTEDEFDMSANSSCREGGPPVRSAWPAKGGHRTMVCRHCCEEVRALDGEIRCLGCLRAEECG